MGFPANPLRGSVKRFLLSQNWTWSKTYRLSPGGQLYKLCGNIPACSETAQERGFTKVKLIVTALTQEARPLIDALNLKRVAGSRKIPVYAGEDAMLVITGMGKVSAAVATTQLLHSALARMSHKFSDLGKLREGGVCLINVGACGAVAEDLALGEAVLAHKIWDRATDREYFPDVLLKHPLREVSLGTFDRPLKGVKEPQFPCQAVDMEASGSFQAAHLFLAPHQMMFLKVVVDYAQSSDYDLAEMQRWYIHSMPDLLPLIRKAHTWDGAEPVLSDGQERLLAEVATQMRLTQTQTHQLEQAAQSYMVRGGENLDLLKPHLQTRPQHKSSRNRILSSILAALNGA